MRIIEKTVYTYAELSDSAKENAKQWFSSGGYTWIDEGIDSIKAFCGHYGIELKDYSLSPYAYSYIETNAENRHFRGVTLKKVLLEKDLMPTGYCVDCDLFYAMAENMKENGGNALAAFNFAIDAGKKSILADMEYQDSDEYIAEVMEINNYEFDENGRV
jgi:hypothetical protein